MIYKLWILDPSKLATVWRTELPADKTSHFFQQDPNCCYTHACQHPTTHLRPRGLPGMGAQIILAWPASGSNSLYGSVCARAHVCVCVCLVVTIAPMTTKAKVLHKHHADYRFPSSVTLLWWGSRRRKIKRWPEDLRKTACGLKTSFNLMKRLDPKGDLILSYASEAKLRCFWNKHLRFKAGKCNLFFFSFFFNHLTFIVATQQDQCSCTGGHMLTPLGAAVFTGPVALHSSWNLLSNIVGGLSQVVLNHLSGAFAMKAAEFKAVICHISTKLQQFLFKLSNCGC